MLHQYRTRFRGALVSKGQFRAHTDNVRLIRTHLKNIFEHLKVILKV